MADTNNRKVYRFNLIAETRAIELKNLRIKMITRTMGTISLSLLLIGSLIYVWRVISMMLVINNEKKQIIHLEKEYQTYQATNIVVSKADIELLDKLQSNRIFWTKHLEVMALHLPDSYWIDGFSYKDSTFDVYGGGVTSPAQEQLVTLDGYLNVLREEPVMKKVFKNIYFNSVERSNDISNQQVKFSFSALKQGGQNAPQ